MYVLPISVGVLTYGLTYISDKITVQHTGEHIVLLRHLYIHELENAAVRPCCKQ